MSGIGDFLINAGYFYFTAHHRHKPELIEEYTRMFISRGAQGIIAVDTLLDHPALDSDWLQLPVIVGWRGSPRRSRPPARCPVDALASACAGASQDRFYARPVISSDSEARWKALSLPRDAGDSDSSGNGGHAGSRHSHPNSAIRSYSTLATGKPFTALVAFNDISAIGAIRALQDANLRVPADVSVIGFDDIKAAGFTLPRLTTIHQPLESSAGLPVNTCWVGFKARLQIAAGDCRAADIGRTRVNWSGASLSGDCFEDERSAEAYDPGRLQLDTCLLLSDLHFVDLELKLARLLDADESNSTQVAAIRIKR